MDIGHCCTSPLPPFHRPVSTEPTGAEPPSSSAEVSSQDGQEGPHDQRRAREEIPITSHKGQHNAPLPSPTAETHLRIEKQKAQGTGLPVGPRTTHCIVTLEEVLSNACLAKASYKSTTETVSSNCSGSSACERERQGEDDAPQRCTSCPTTHPDSIP